MKVIITEVSGMREQIIANALAQLAVEFGVPVENGATPVKTREIAAPVAVAEEKPAPAKYSHAKPARPTPARAMVEAEPDAPKKVTIRSRIIELLKTGPKGSDEVARMIGGVNADRSLAGQHLYLLVRDKLAVRDDETNTWSLA